MASRDRVRGEVTSRDCLARGPSSGRRVRRQASSGVPCHALSTVHYRTLGPLGGLCISTTTRQRFISRLPARARTLSPQTYVTLILHCFNFSLDLCTPSVRRSRRIACQAYNSAGVQGCSTANQTKECIAWRSAPFPSPGRTQPWHSNRSESGAPGARVPQPTVVSVVRCQCGRAACGSFLTLIL